MSVPPRDASSHRDPERHVPARPFPPYAFLPGRDPHPNRDPEGHSYGKEEEPVAYRESGDWRANIDYLYGVDLYNHGYLWEAHEAWEGIWHRSKHDALQAEFLQGLIQCAAASLKIPMGQKVGLERLSKMGLGRLQVVAERAGPIYMGLDLPAFLASFRGFVASDPDSEDERPPIELT